MSSTHFWHWRRESFVGIVINLARYRFRRWCQSDSFCGVDHVLLSNSSVDIFSTFNSISVCQTFHLGVDFMLVVHVVNNARLISHSAAHQMHGSRFKLGLVVDSEPLFARSHADDCDCSCIGLFVFNSSSRDTRDYDTHVLLGDCVFGSL